MRLATGLSIGLLWIGPAAYLAAEAHRTQSVSPWAAVWLAVPILVAGAQGQLARALAERARALALSGDGSVLFAGGWDGTVHAFQRTEEA